MLKVCLIGYGSMGKMHATNCRHMDGVEVVAAADPSKKALKQAKSMGIPNLYSDYHDLLTHSKSIEIDVAIISVPNFLHFEASQLALEAGLAVFMEKPMATTVRECQMIVNSVQNSGRKFMVGHNYRFLNTIEKMKSTLDKGHIGNLEVITLEMVGSGPFSDWWFDSEKTGGGALIDKGVHLIDLYRHFAGDAKVLSSFLDHKFNLPLEDGAIVILGSSSTKGIINVGWYQKVTPAVFDFHVTLHGNAGFIASDIYTRDHFYRYAIKEAAKNIVRRAIGKKIRPLSYIEVHESYYKELKHFLDCVKTDQNSPVGASAVDGLRAMEIIEDAYKTSSNQHDF